ncbi:MAG: outer membrane beta-barrel protein [Alphaproteobacteria bacterium]|nr:outer membrane beta-barrel protein [Alphaproteobacteria bacterium]
MSRGIGFSFGVALFAVVFAGASVAQEAGGEMWTGYHAGVVGTWVSGDATVCDNQTCNAPGQAYPGNDFDGLFGGLSAGVDWQVGSLVIGAAGDWSWGDAEGFSRSITGFGCSTGCVTEVDSIGTVRARLGLALDGFMPFVTAGMAMVDYRVSLGTAQDDHQEMSFAGGAGAEFFVTDSMTANLEYLYIDGQDDLDIPTCGAAPNNCFVNVEEIHSARVGLNFRFW